MDKSYPYDDEIVIQGCHKIRKSKNKNAIKPLDSLKQVDK